MVKVSSEGARAILDAFLEQNHPAIARDIAAAQEIFGQGEWVGFYGEGEAELRAKLTAYRDGVASKALLDIRKTLSMPSR